MWPTQTLAGIDNLNSETKRLSVHVVVALWAIVRDNAACPRLMDSDLRSPTIPGRADRPEPRPDGLDTPIRAGNRLYGG